MEHEHLHNTAKIFKERRLLRMQILRQKRLKPRTVAPKKATRRGCMNSVELLISFLFLDSINLLIKLLTCFQ
jgi:hypothetical protein